MAGRNFTEDFPVAMHWSNPAGRDVLVAIRHTNSARDLREALVSLSYAVSIASRPASALCVVVDSRLSGARLRVELDRFRAIVHPELGPKLYLAGARTAEVGCLDGEAPETSQAFMEALFDAVRRERYAAGAARVTRQQVKAALVERELWGLPPLTLADLRRQTGASYQTADAALLELQRQGVVSGERDGPIRLHGLRPQALHKLADEHAGAHKSFRFIDPTASARPPCAMADRLLSLRGRYDGLKVTVSGVMGALHYFPDLDITAPTRLDLSVYDGDQSFVAKLDAGLVSTDDENRKPVVLLHMRRDCRPPDIVDPVPSMAARLDCLADLLELGLQAEAAAFAFELCRAARKAR
jgi:DNA-binding transcriptional ArsR family regulator